MAPYFNIFVGHRGQSFISLFMLLGLMNSNPCAVGTLKNLLEDIGALFLKLMQQVRKSHLHHVIIN